MTVKLLYHVILALQHLANICKLLKSTLCHPLLMRQVLSFTVFDHAYIYHYNSQSLAPNLLRAEHFNEQPNSGQPSSKCDEGCGWKAGVTIISRGTWQLKHKYNVFKRLWSSKHGYEMAKSKHKFKRFCGGQEENSHYFQAVVNWIWKPASFTVMALLYDGWAQSIISRHFDVHCLYQIWS